jgi:hypothetical protein
VPWWRAAAPLARERPLPSPVVGSMERRARALERRELLAGLIGGSDSTLLDAVPEDEELEYV